MSEKFDPFFVPDVLAKLANEFLPYETTGKFYTANEIRELGDVIGKLKTIARKNACELSRLLWNEKARNENSVHTNDNVVVFPRANNNNIVSTTNPTNDGAA